MAETGNLSGAEGVLVQVLGVLTQTAAAEDPEVADRLRQVLAKAAQDCFVGGDTGGLDAVVELRRALPSVADPDDRAAVRRAPAKRLSKRRSPLDGPSAGAGS
ncbi:hypothetical protein [Methylobacterium nodulans]|uniref:Uncharacterized protein n=1 Tax=Methylobacterium nodulans (strain LMG 21967 / CNCM I-2342 / ORS 2060) TaxID=460265 RepID=B8IVV0_METNO|nr:hypothetical protein [Methylobacterium nodulans]ACL62540.1 hypothetical protein Mnod_8423 [Methylobacterium nodulans ORS 2060]